MLVGLSVQVVLHWHCLVHTCSEHLSQAAARVESGTHSPSPVQPLQLPQPQPPSQERVCVPQFPHGRDWVSPGLHEPPFPQPPQAPHWHEALQVRDCVPQLPHGWESLALGSQTPWFTHSAGPH